MRKNPLSLVSPSRLPGISVLEQSSYVAPVGDHKELDQLE